MEKLKLHSPDLTAKNIDKIFALFPNCVTEATSEAGSVTKAIDFDLLRQELSGSVVEGTRERYQLDWPGKREALLTANAPIAKTLRPFREESVNFDVTKNLFIEGDNLDALKLLQETYLGKVKMIYIDPPYNTGNDFIYEDDFAEDSATYLKKSQQVDEKGSRLVANPETNGRFHSDWLTMLYPRLKLAANLLSENGVIFISVDDGEVSNARKMCDQIFGEEQFAAQIIWKKRNTPPNDRVIGAQHDYILVYVKQTLEGIMLRPRSAEQIARYQNPDKHPKGPWVAGDLTSNVKGGRYVASLYYPIKNPRTQKEFYPANNGNWRFNRDRIQRLLDNNEIYFGRDDTSAPKLKRFLCDVKEGATWTTLWDFAPLNTVGSQEMEQIFESGIVFENPKPTGLLHHILEAGCGPSGIVLDFFAGASSTAHAVIQQNAIDGGHRRFIMVQLPEPTPPDSDAFKRGFKTIADLSKERIRRAGAKIKAETATALTDLDVGFRVLKVDTSNMKDVYYTPDSVKQDDLIAHSDNIKADRQPEDLLFQVLVDWGVDLALPIAQEKIAKKTVFFVDGNALAACFESNITEELVKELAKRKPLRAVFRDSSYGSDSVKINVEQIFKLISPSTEIKSL
jgi:adenine-specific DNA-methyltransferase